MRPLRLMSLSLPPLGWFRAFEAAARHLSFTLAAVELNLTQSAISQHVRSLEVRLGTPLFLRKARGLALTDAGRRLLPQATEAIQKLAAATAMFQAPTRDGTVRVACTTSFAVLYLIPRLAKFLATYPGANVQIVSTLWPDDVTGADADVNIRFGPIQTDSDESLIRRDVVVPVCAPSLRNPLQNRGVDRVEWKSLAFIRTVGHLDTWDAWSRTLGIPAPKRFIQTVDSYLLAIESARAGLGIALVCRLLVEDDLATGKLVPLMDSEVEALEGYQVSKSQPFGGDALPGRFISWVLSDRK